MHGHHLSFFLFGKIQIPQTCRFKSPQHAINESLFFQKVAMPFFLSLKSDNYGSIKFRMLVDIGHL